MSKAIITSRQYSNLFGTGTTNYLTGNAGDVIECTIGFEVRIEALSSYSNTFAYSTDRITRTTGSWFDDGFAENQSIEFSYDVITTADPSDPTTTTTTTFTFTADIVTLTPTIMICNNISGSDSASGSYTVFIPNIITPFRDSPNEITATEMYATNGAIQGIDFEYGLVTNTQTASGNATSLIDGSTTRFENLNINVTNTNFVPLTPLGEESGAAVLSAEIKGLGAPVNYVNKFEIKIKYIITPLWESLTNIQTPSLPTFYDDKECIADVFNIKMLPQSGNPNISVSTSSSETKLLGNTGFFEENYNGKLNNYNVDSYNLFVNGIPSTGIQTSGQTDFSIVIYDPNNSPSSKYKMGFVWSPDDDSLFQNNFNPNQENLIYNGLDDSNPLVPTTTVVNYSGTQNSVGAAMDIELKSLTRSGNLVTIQGTFKPNAAFGTFMDAQITTDQNYLLWVSVGDDALATNISDRVSLIVELGGFTQEKLPLETWDILNSFLEHPQPESQVGVGTYIGCSEDEILSRGIIKLDTSKNETIQEITFTIEGYNSITQQSYVLESNTYDTSGFLKDAQGVQQIALDETRGFKMATGVNKNFVKIERSPIDDVGNIVGYRSLYAFRARWEDWIANTNVPSLFYDNTKLNDDLNNNWATKDNIANWGLTFTIKLVVESAGNIINTENRFILNIRDYEESNVWDGEITTFDTTKANSLFIGTNQDNIRQNALLKSSNTWIQADFDLEDPLGNVGDISDYYGVIRVEEYRNGGIFEIDMLSTVLTNETTNNLLVPLTGETACKITKISDTKIRLECYLDYTKLNTSVFQYKISARLGCGGIHAGKYSQQYSVKYD